MCEYRVIVDCEEHMLPQEVHEQHGTTIEAPSLKEARETFAERMFDFGFFREEYEGFMDMYRIPKSLADFNIVDDLLMA